MSTRIELRSARSVQALEPHEAATIEGGGLISALLLPPALLAGADAVRIAYELAKQAVLAKIPTFS